MRRWARAGRVGPALERLLAETSAPLRVRSDPVELVHRYTDPLDVEIAGLLSAALAYGRVELFKPRLSALLEALGPSPAAVARDARPAERFVQLARDTEQGVADRFRFEPPRRHSPQQPIESAADGCRGLARRLAGRGGRIGLADGRAFDRRYRGEFAEDLVCRGEPQRRSFQFGYILADIRLSCAAGHERGADC